MEIQMELRNKQYKIQLTTTITYVIMQQGVFLKMTKNAFLLLFAAISVLVFGTSWTTTTVMFIKLLLYKLQCKNSSSYHLLFHMINEEMVTGRRNGRLAARRVLNCLTVSIRNTLT